MIYWYIFALPSTPKWLSVISPSRCTSQFSKNISIVSYEQHPWLGVCGPCTINLFPIPFGNSGFSGSPPALLFSPLRNMPGGGNDAPWKHFYEKGWPTDYPEKEEKSLTKSCWWLEEIMHQLRYDRVLSQLGQSFWIINRMTWSFKFWKWSVSPFRSVYFVSNWRMIVSSPEETYLKEKTFLIEVFPFRVCAWDTVGLFSPSHWFFWG